MPHHYLRWAWWTRTTVQISDYVYGLSPTTETETISCLMCCGSDVAVFSILNLQFVFCLLFWTCVLHFPTTVAFHADNVPTCVFGFFSPLNPTQLLCIYGNNNNPESWHRRIADGNANSEPVVIMALHFLVLTGGCWDSCSAERIRALTLTPTLQLRCCCLLLFLNC